MQSVYPFRYEAGNGYGKLQATIINLGITMGFSEYYTTHSTKEIADVSDFSEIVSVPFSKSTSEQHRSLIEKTRHRRSH